MAVFHFVSRICKVTVNNQTIFIHQGAKDAFDNITKEKTVGESEADRAKELLSNSERKHLPALCTNAFTIMNLKKKLKTLWPLFMDGVQLPQG